jgi:hypothetical protein
MYLVKHTLQTTGELGGEDGASGSSVRVPDHPGVERLRFTLRRFTRGQPVGPQVSSNRPTSATPSETLREPEVRGAESPDLRGGRLGAAWNVMAFRRGGAARSIPRIRIPGEHTRDRSILVGKLAELLRGQRPTHKVAAMFIDVAFGSPIYERLPGVQQRLRAQYLTRNRR